MAVGSGIDGQLGLAQETTVGTAVTVTEFVEFNKESLQFTQEHIQGVGIHAGGQYNRASRHTRTTKSVGGDVELDFAEKGMGILLKNMLGSSATPTQITPPDGLAFKQVHNPGSLTGLGLTLQKGVPQASDQTVKAYTYNGAKITEWTLSNKVNEILNLALTFDAWNEDDAVTLATASYPITHVFEFTQAVLKLGGTASKVSGVTSLASGVETTGLTSFTIKGTNPVAGDRYFLGTDGIKAEQLENNYRSISVSLEGEFNKSTLYDLFKNATSTAVQITYTGSNIETGNDFSLDIILPDVIFDTGTNQIDGPDIVPIKLDGMALDDQSTTPVQITYVSTDSSL